MAPEVDKIKAALAAWINSQDLSPNYGAAALAEMAGYLCGAYSQSWQDVWERVEIMQGLLAVMAKKAYRQGNPD